MEPFGLKYENVSLHKEQLASIADKFIDEPKPAEGEINLGPFAPFINWGLEFSTGAEIILKEKKIESDIAELEAQKKKAQLIIERNETIK